MPQNADTRIIQMQFDNRAFERDIKKSEKSVNRFKQALDFSKCEKGLDGLSKATKNLTFDHLVDNIQKLTDKFTGLGTVSELVLSQIRRGIEETARKISGLVDSLAFDTIGEGKDKFEQMNKNVQTIMAATGRSESDVYKVMERLNKYTDQTSYNFTDMAANIGKFTSVGIGLERAERQMEGIANWAARSGAGVAEASRAMYNLSQAMGVGHLLKIDWKSIENAGMATKEFKQELIDAGLAEGTLVLSTDKTGKTVVKTAKKLGKQVEVTYSNLAETLQKKWATQNVIGKTLEGYYRSDLDPDAVTKPIVEMTDKQLAAVKEKFDDFKLDADDFKYLKDEGLATDKLKKKLIEVGIEQGKIAKAGTKNGKELYKTTAKTGKQITFTMAEIEKSLETGWLDRSVGKQAGLMENLADASYKAAQKCTTLKDVFAAWKDQLSTGWMKVWQKIFGGLTESMELFSAICNKVGDAFSRFIEILVGDGEKTEGIFGWWEKLGGRNSLWSLFVGEYDGLYEGAYGILDAIGDITEMISRAFWDLMYTLNAGPLQEKGMSRDEWFANEDYRTWFMGAKMKSVTDNIREFIQSIKDFFNQVPAGSTKTRWQQIQDFVSGIANVVGIAWISIKDVVGFASKVAEMLQPAIDVIISILEALGIEIQKTGEEVSKGHGLKAFFEKLLPIIQPVTDAINGFAQAVGGIILQLIGSNEAGSKTISVWNAISEVFLKIAKVVAKVAAPIITFLTEVITAVNDTFKNGVDSESIKAFGEKVKTALKKMFDSIFNFTPNFSAKVLKLWADLKDVFKSGFSKKSIKKLSDDFGVLFADFKKSIPKTVKDSAKSIYESIKKFISDMWAKIKAFFSPLFNDIKNVFTSGFSADSFAQLKNRFSTIFQTISSYIPEELKGAFRGIVDKVKAYLLGIWEKVKKKISDILGIKFDAPGGESVFDRVSSWVQERYEAFKKPIEELLGGGDSETGEKKGVIARITGFVTGVLGAGNKEVDGNKKNVFSRISEFITTEHGKLKETVNRILGTAAAEGEDTSIPGKISAYINGIFGAGEETDVENKPGIFDRVLAWLDEKVGKLRTFIQELVGNTEGDEATLKNALSKIDLSKIMIIMIGALGLMGIIKTGKKIWTVLKSVSEISKTIAGIPKQINEALHGGGPIETRADKFLKLAIAIGIIAAALIFVGNMRWEDAVKGTIIIAAIGAGLFFMVKYLNKEMKDTGDTRALLASFAGMLIMAISIAMIVSAISKIGKLDDTQYYKALLAFGGIIAGFQYVNNMLARGADFQWKNMAGLLAFAGAITLLAIAMRIIGGMDWVQIGKGLAGIGGVLVLLFVFAKVMNKNAGISMKNTGMKELTFLALSVAILALALVPLALLPLGRLAQAVAAVGIIIFMLYKFVVSINKNSGTTMAGTAMAQLIAVVGAVLLLVIAMIPLALMDFGQMIRAISGIALLLLLLCGVVRMVNEDKSSLSKTGMIQLIAVALAVQMLVIAMIPLALMNIAQLLQGLAGVGVLLLLLCGFIKLVNENSASMKATGMIQLLAVAGAVILLVLAMIPLALMDPISLLSAVGAVVVLILALSVAVIALSKLKGTFTQALGTIGILIVFAAIIYVFGVAMEKIKDIKWETMIGFSAALVILLLGMAAVMLVLSAIPNPAAILTSLVALAAGLGAVLLVISALVPIMMNAFASGLEQIMPKLAIVANLFSSFASGMNDVSESDLDSIKRKFEKLMEIMGVVKDAGSYQSGIKAFENSMLMLGNAVSQFNFSTRDVDNPASNNGIAFVREILTMKDELSGFSIGSFKTDIAELGEGIRLFGESTSGTSELTAAGIKMIQDLAGEADNLQTLAALPLDSLKNNIANLGGALKLYAAGAAEADGLEEADVPDIQKAIDLMQAVMVSLNADDSFGTLPDLPAEGDLTDFGVELVTLATAMKDFATASQDLGDTTKALTLLGFLGNLRGRLTEQNLATVKAFDDNGISRPILSSFGIELGVLGTSLKRFAENTKDFTYNQEVKNALTFFADLRERLTSENLRSVKAFSNAGIDESVLTTFGTEIGELGEALSKFAENVNFDKSKQENFEAAIMALDNISLIARRLPVIGGLSDLLFGHTTTLGELGKNLSELGAGFSLFSNSLEASDNKFEYNHKLVNDVIDSLLSLSDVIAIINQVGVNQANGEAWGIAPAVSRLNEFISRMNEGSEIAEGLAKMVGNFVESFNELDKEYDISTSLAAFTAFRDMAEGIAALVNVDPSLDFSQVGRKIGTGIIQGLKDEQEAVRDAVITLVSLGEIFGSSTDSNPTIKPVVDLSNATAGAAALNKLFSNPYGLSVDSEGVMSIDLTKASLYAEDALPQNYSGTLDDIKSEVSSLRGDMRDLASAMTKMKFVFNSGAVVAAIGPEMDEYLGRLGYYSVRADIP